MPTDIPPGSGGALPEQPPQPPRRRPERGYGFTVADVLNPERKYPPDVLRALRAFRATKPWQGSPDERMSKLKCLHDDLCIAYRLADPPPLRFSNQQPDHYNLDSNEIVLSMRLSVLTYLHEFVHARDRGRSSEREAASWSINLFKRMFPRSYSQLVPVAHLLVRREDVQQVREAMGLDTTGESQEPPHA